jgi:Tfp pilus assembly protein PilE
MGKIRNNEDGFSPLEVVMALVIVALISAVGFMVYKNHKTTSSNNQSVAQSSTATKTQPTTTTTPQPSATSDPYVGWKSYEFKGWFSFKYPADYHISTEGEGSDTIAITSYTFNPDGTPTDFHCAASGYSVPACDVKVELTHKADGSVGSTFYPDNSQLKSTAQLIIASIKKD